MFNPKYTKHKFPQKKLILNGTENLPKATSRGRNKFFIKRQ